MNAVKSPRNSYIETLRILAMMMIIGLHYLNASMGGALNQNNIPYGTVNYYISNVLETICIVSVNIFVLITGYYSVSTTKKENYSTGIKKPINLYVIMLFYGLVFLGVAVALKQQELSYSNIIRTVFPFLYRRRCFVETYIMLMLLSPFLNKLLCSLSKKNYAVLLGIWIALFSVWTSFFSNPPIKDAGYGIVHFITLYMIAGFIKLHIELNKKTKIQVLSFFITTVSMIITYFLRNWISGWNYDFILNIVSAVFIFIYFLSMKPRYNGIINRIASTTFGVYLIHTDFSLKNFIYQDILHCNKYYQSSLFIIHFVISVIIMFVIGMIIDALRQFLWKITIDKWLKNVKLTIKA